MTVVWQPAKNAVAKTNAFQPELLPMCPFSDASDDRGSPAAAGIAGSVKPSLGRFEVLRRKHHHAETELNTPFWDIS
jgi:hypothetical protein